VAENGRRPKEADVLDRFREEWPGQLLPPGGIWTSNAKVGRVYIGMESLEAGDAAVSGLGAITGGKYRVPDSQRRGLFADATYTLGRRVWVFEVKTVLRNQDAWAVGAQVWLYRKILAREHPGKRIDAWVITTRFEGNRLYREVLLDAFMKKLSIGFLFLDEGSVFAPQRLRFWE